MSNCGQKSGSGIVLYKCVVVGAWRHERCEGRVAGVAVATRAVSRFKFAKAKATAKVAGKIGGNTKSINVRWIVENGGGIGMAKIRCICR